MQEKRLQKIRREGGSRVIAVTHILPDWLLVNIRVIEQNKTSIIVRFDRVTYVSR